MPNPNEKGSQFEDRVDDVLARLAKDHPKRVEYSRQPRVELQNGEIVVPDFDLRVLLHHQRNHYWIECQDRKRSSKDILHKIQHVRHKQWRKTFLFLHSRTLPDEMSRALDAEGVIHLTIDEFEAFVDLMSEELAMLPNLPDKAVVLVVGCGYLDVRVWSRINAMKEFSNALAKKKDL